MGGQDDDSNMSDMKTLMDQLNHVGQAHEEQTIFEAKKLKSDLVCSNLSGADGDFWKEDGWFGDLELSQEPSVVGDPI